MHRTERAASGVMGAAKAVKATLEGVTGVFRQLMREHGEVSALLRRVKMSTDPAVREELFPVIQTQLIAHERAELVEIYPLFKKHESLASYAEMHEREADALERHLQRLSLLPCDDPGWASAFDDLVDEVARHVHEEENEYFPVASRKLGRKVTEAMTVRYDAKRNAVLRELGSG